MYILISVGRFNIKMLSYQYSLTTVLSLTWESPYLGKMVFILRQGPDFEAGAKNQGGNTSPVCLKEIYMT